MCLRVNFQRLSSFLIHYKMTRGRVANLLFLLAVLAFLLRTMGASIGMENDAEEEKELHLSRTKDAYSFLEASLNALEVNKPPSPYEKVKRNISHAQMGYIHHEMIKKLKNEKLNNITNIRNVISRCVSDSIQHTMRAITSILEEVLSYNEFCTSLDEHFSYLYDANITFKKIVKSCRTVTEDKLRGNYLSQYVEDFKLILQALKSPHISFHDFDDISKCMAKFYQSFISPFQVYVPETSFYRKFVEVYANVKGLQKIENFVKEFLKTFHAAMSTEEITLFFDELFSIYTRSSSQGRCLYQQK
ncbi:conserved Plasmodium protein, unknown function [Plasmodium knowlesi strain H]|uniref:Uncharacterized protein n=3 Tax=Plasmodium knowlesi TaxID=5850 RepID=A0A1A7VJY5_PLAKH|nr:conserved Plasmodium protein, unknown function [Plasmodium knowlesi strain H]OTN65977.1 Uncharacterized protein PKNOH_S100054700 [Plasmodium knowlesi]CAA9987905.1 conserved Plasmodium protein, unknown function [Plasmodium knowlesi strain H]SBO22250.1 conserved Plasmodium protein, unknown function [Plasmodium knowlesi strain H]SBO28838.1 conserved Plasmodium protein, unknown function [Plasmodium knowlesi strain H]VVS77379.1 conserved Plasmodium protein, unknown function [Plasmodium knowlesi 